MKNAVINDSVIINPEDLMEHTQPRPSRASVRWEFRRARQAVQASIKHSAAYGRMPAEVQSAARITSTTLENAREAARRAWCSRAGRRIDLKTLLGQLRADGSPVWTIVDPAQIVSEQNGKYDTDGSISIGNRWVKFFDRSTAPVRKAFVPTGIPALPAKARRLFQDRTIRRRANWVGLLYQPDAWTEVRPDPAVVVEWQDRPGEYYALAVWGGDYHRIMEFID